MNNDGVKHLIQSNTNPSIERVFRVLDKSVVINDKVFSLKFKLQKVSMIQFVSKHSFAIKSFRASTISFK